MHIHQFIWWALLSVVGCSEYKFQGGGEEVASEGVDREDGPRIEVTPAVVDYGVVAPGDVIEEIVTVRNVGEDTLQIYSVFLDLNEGSTYDFVVLDSFLWEMEPGEDSLLAVSIRGPEDEIRQGRLRVESNDPAQREADVDLIHDLPERDVPSGDPPADDDDPSDDDPPIQDDPPDDDPPTPEVPPEIVEDCDTSVTASFESDEIYVLSWSSTSATGTLISPASGWFHLYDTSLSESGASQFNESAYLRIASSLRPDGTPYFGNCGDDWVVQDSDNFGVLPTESRIYVGTFWLDEGENTLTMHHYCPLYRSGECPDLHFEDDPGGTCDSDNVNSVHYGGYGICIERMVGGPEL